MRMSGVTVRLWLFRRLWVPGIVFVGIHVLQGNDWRDVILPFSDETSARIAVKGLYKAYKRAGATVKIDKGGL